MAEEVEVDPTRVATTHPTAQPVDIEVLRGREIEDGERQMKRRGALSHGASNQR
jgi:hypothetical protein